jgi:hypothetical protein
MNPKKRFNPQITQISQMIQGMNCDRLMGTQLSAFTLPLNLRQSAKSADN